MAVKNFIPLFVRRSLGTPYDRWIDQRKKRQTLRKLKGDLVECNVCGSKFRAFADDCWHPGTVCPNCGSQIRHRLLVATLDGLSLHPEFSETHLVREKDILHFAPERQLRDRIRKAGRRYVTADYDRGDCDLKLDMSDMPSVTEQTFNLIIACDVLEHVPDDLAAMRELHRILRPGGSLILSVPQMDPPAVTDEDPFVTGASERERRFGQKDHVRMYGDDFMARLISTGFEVAALSEADFSPDLRARLVLMPPVKSANRLATNFRRIYFCKKSSPV